jgi:hypothetical protein
MMRDHTASLLDREGTTAPHCDWMMDAPTKQRDENEMRNEGAPWIDPRHPTTLMITPQVETRFVWSTTFARHSIRNNNLTPLV